MCSQTEINLEREEFYKLLGNLERSFIDFEWNTVATRLIDYVYDSNRKQIISNYKIMVTGFAERLNLLCFEIKSAIQGIGPLKTGEEEIGRFCVRILDFLRPSQLYIVLNQDSTSCEKTIALLHEIGHFVHHFELLQSNSALYQRICLNPSLEYEIGRFVNETYGFRLKMILEMEADLFALCWLSPLGLVKNLKEESNVIAQTNLTKNGYIFQAHKDLFSNMPASKIDRTKIIELNKRGEETRQREQNRDYPIIGESLITRMSWILFNRSRLMNRICDERYQLLLKYFNIAGPPRYTPELRKKYTNSINSVNHSQYSWVERIKPDEVYRKLNMDHWEPLLVMPTDKSLPPYHIPITPIPSTNPSDNEINWQHMLKAETSLPRRVDDWLEKAFKQHAGLLIFPRNPAEKILDEQFSVR